MSKLTKIKSIADEKKISLYEAFRVSKGWTRARASIETAMSPETVQRIEKGKDPAKDQIMMMDRVYGCSGELIDYWLGRIKFSRQKENSHVFEHKRATRKGLKNFLTSILSHWRKSSKESIVRRLVFAAMWLLSVIWFVNGLGGSR